MTASSTTTAPDVTRIEIPGGLLVRVRGKIDAAFAGLGIPPGFAGEIVIDLAGVERITSSGVRGWMAARPELEHARAVWLSRVPPCVVSQLNAVAGFAGRCGVISLFLPFVCAACGNEQHELLDLRQSLDSERTGPGPVPCPKCGGTASLDEEPADYLAFVAHAPRPQLSAVATRLLRDDVGNETTLMIEKEVSGTVTMVRLSGPLCGRQRLARRLDGLDGKVLVDLTHVTVADAEGVADLAAALRAGAASTWFRGAAREVLDLLQAADPELARRHLTEGSVIDPEIAAVLAPPGTPSTPDSDALPAGFQQIRCLGAGGMAEVFLARRTGPGALEKLVAVKRILPSLVKNERFRALFQREARVAALVSHPNVVQTFELLEQDGQLLLVMEYVDGWDLGWLVDRAQASALRPPPEVALRVGLDLLAGLAAAHAALDARGNRAAVIHRDVSPHNALMTKDGVTKVADFGVAKSMGEVGMDTRSAVMGKVAYMAPEQINPALGAVGPHSDVYSAALVLFELLAVEHPFVRSGAFEAIQAVLHGPLPPLSLEDGELAGLLARWFDQALARPIDQRFADGCAALDALRRAVEPRWVAPHAEVARWAGAVADSCLPARGAQESGLTPAADPKLRPPQVGDRTQVLSEEDLAVDDG